MDAQHAGHAKQCSHHAQQHNPANVMDCANGVRACSNGRLDTAVPTAAAACNADWRACTTPMHRGGQDVATQLVAIKHVAGTHLGGHDNGGVGHKAKPRHDVQCRQQRHQNFQVHRPRVCKRGLELWGGCGYWKQTNRKSGCKQAA